MSIPQFIRDLFFGRNSRGKSYPDVATQARSVFFTIQRKKKKNPTVQTIVKTDFYQRKPISSQYNDSNLSALWSGTAWFLPMRLR